MHKRLYFIDLMKFVSMLIVFFHHIMMDMYVVHPMTDLNVLSNIIFRPNLNLTMLACATFVFVSGYTVQKMGIKDDLFAFYKKRLLRVLIPFYIAYITYFCIKLYTKSGLYDTTGVPIWRFIFTIFGIDEYLSASGFATFSQGVGEWFLGCIIMCYMIFPLLYKLNNKYKTALFIFMSVYYILINVFYEKLGIRIASHLSIYCQIYNFYLGMMIASRNKNKYSIKRTLVAALLFLFMLLYPYNIPILENIRITIGVVCAFTICSNLEKVQVGSEQIKKALTLFSKISLEIYLVHHFIIYEVDIRLGFRTLGRKSTLLIIMLDIVATLILSSLISFLSSKLIRLMDVSKEKRKSYTA